MSQSCCCVPSARSLSHQTNIHTVSRDNHNVLNVVDALGVVDLGATCEQLGFRIPVGAEPVSQDPEHGAQ